MQLRKYHPHVIVIVLAVNSIESTITCRVDVWVSQSQDLLTLDEANHLYLGETWAL